MAIYGVMLLSVCMFVGVLLGDILGVAVGVNSNIGGVGFAMLFLIILSDYMLERDMLSDKAQAGIEFWGMLYIPVVVAMTANQNVVAALSGGPMAILAGVLSVVVAFAFIPILEKNR